MILQTQCRSQRGLTTLEWLLIVAAVAGLAALAVVLVQNVVDDTAEEITGNNARITAAKVAADRINSDAIDEFVQKAKTDKIAVTLLDAINSEFSSKCERLAITYSDVLPSAKQKPEWDNFSGSGLANSSVDVKKSELEQEGKGCKIIAINP